MKIREFMNLEQLILKNLIVNEEYSRKVLPFIKPEYFSARETTLLFNDINYNLSSCYYISKDDMIGYLTIKNSYNVGKSKKQVMNKKEEYKIHKNRLFNERA